ncbi:SUF system NifU family Fe-S cluster assembly protein [Halalkalibacterium halodurans]|uniref:Nitrogen fixation protein n=1 Tax=Halalkalibacterium halodurans (strain ATCC BAA-125 / DSM 18197 / FERM 7344 / JCM 9153 / C-125) TaxID=272558 RepID=Q9KFV2_HALH5|nr:SUF system NifU family Fe-S cluster assembly protein [Halalkalibacterium halodurans]MED4125138.1 SUF system NifU family Fe-S cluster assembly protein [Halalkalibacterium halodurans]MED4172832.1 SUF system NifU family Fe-S cluster assembly protein [Halalkalibacterium halodurans]BAB04088.1 nitrogen fixation protein [Halalkalibacterium halodurans C-125]
MLEHLYRQLVIDHAKKRRNHRRISGEHVQQTHYKNPTCGDVITLYVELQGHHVDDIAFVGEGCSISMASASMMTELLKGVSLEEASSMRHAMERMIRHGEISSDVDLGDALSLEGVHKLRGRHNCALMAWQALDRVIGHETTYEPVARS